jgi:alpha/beta superfamily hydrolase
MTFIIPAGSVQLEAHLREPGDAVRGAAVLCHPHPVYGGTMDTRVVYRAAKAVAAAGFAALRFNFRGVGKSTGQYDQGIAEKEDVAAATDWLEKKYPGKYLAVVGYSFGAWVGLQAGYADTRIKALVGLGLPLDLYDLDFLIQNSRPSLYIVGTKDEFCPADKLDRLSSRLPSSSELHRIEGAGHFFDGYIDAVESLIAGFFRKLETGRGTI